MLGDEASLEYAGVADFRDPFQPQDPVNLSSALLTQVLQGSSSTEEFPDPGALSLKYFLCAAAGAWAGCPELDPQGSWNSGVVWGGRSLKDHLIPTLAMRRIHEQDHQFSS